MALFPQSFIDEVRAAADIVAVVSDSVSLRKAGTTYKGLCPFHGEKTPSFTVNTRQGLLPLLRLRRRRRRVQVRRAAGEGRLPGSGPASRAALRHSDPGAGGGGERRETAAEREALVKIHEVAVALFPRAARVAGGAQIRQYLLTERGLTHETIDTLQIGFAPHGRDVLRQRLLKQGFSPLQLVTSGLVTRRDDGSEVDRFRNRLMIPIARDTGTVIAFGGRALEKDQQPKYLNSPETPIYTKGRTLYGLNLTKGDLRKVRYALIVEGYFDFAQVYQAGGFPVVATCGTALTPQQAQMLRRFASKAVLCYDPDRAGQTAAERSSELLVAEGFVVNVMQLAGRRRPRHVHAEARARGVRRSSSSSRGRTSSSCSIAPRPNTT